MKTNKEVLVALEQGLKDHGPMSVYQMVGFLNGWGISINEVNGPGYLRTLIHRHKHVFESFGPRKERLYYLKEEL